VSKCVVWCICEFVTHLTQLVKTTNLHDIAGFLNLSFFRYESILAPFCHLLLTSQNKCRETSVSTSYLSTFEVVFLKNLFLRSKELFEIPYFFSSGMRKQ